MVPWHPPCALCSLIFSSLDPETNCCYFFRMFTAFLSLISEFHPAVSQYSVLQLAYSKSLSVQLSRCSPSLFLLSPFGLIWFKAGQFSYSCALKTIQTRNAYSTLFRFDAVRLSVTHSLSVYSRAFALFCYGLCFRFLSAFRPIDLRFSSGISAFAFSLERR